MNMLISLAIIAIGVIGFFLIPPRPKTALIDQLNAKRALAGKIGAQMVAMKSEQEIREDQWIAELESLVTEQKTNLAILRMMPPTVENLDARGSAVISIGGAERTLGMLYERKRGGPDRRQTAANHFEGRM